jgi:hypothetical protein
VLDAFRDALHAFEGSHYFHNYTRRSRYAPEDKRRRSRGRRGDVEEEEEDEMESSDYRGDDDDDVDDVDASVRAVLAASDEPLVALRPPDPGTFSAGEDASSPFVACPRCGLRTAPGRDAQSHADEHMAFDLSKSEPQHRFGSFSSLPKSGGEKKRRPAARNGGGGKKRSVRGDASGTASVSAFFAKR